MGQHRQQHERLKHHGNDGVLPSQFIFVWVHVTEEENRQEILVLTRTLDNIQIMKQGLRHVRVHWVQ